MVEMQPVRRAKMFEKHCLLYNNKSDEEKHVLLRLLALLFTLTKAFNLRLRTRVLNRGYL